MIGLGARQRGPVPRPVAARFWEKVRISDGCWEWLGALDRKGYGRFTAITSKAAQRRGQPGRHVFAHRWAYEAYVGPIPSELVLDHLCFNPQCVRPDHLEAVTRGVNTLRGNTLPAAEAAQTHCHRGHEFTPENTHRRSDGIRECRACCRLRDRARRPPGTSAKPKAHKTHCVRGHELVAPNVRVTPAGARFCRACGRVRDSIRRPPKSAPRPWARRTA